MKLNSVKESVEFMAGVRANMAVYHTSWILASFFGSSRFDLDVVFIKRVEVSGLRCIE